MAYIITSRNKLDFHNNKKVESVDIFTDGSLVINSKPSWINFSVTSSNFLANSETDGRVNTSVICRFESNTITAASLCYSYIVPSYSIYNDWYLPSKDEIKPLIDNKLLLGNYALSKPIYWTSTEATVSNGIKAFSINKDGTYNESSKTSLLGVRPIRKEKYVEIEPLLSIGDNVSYGIVFHVDKTNKIYYIVAYQDLQDTKWGNKTNVANYNFASKIDITANSNSTTNQLSDNIILGIVEDVNLTNSIIVTQDSFVSFSQSVLLKDIIDNMIIRFSNSGSYLYGINRQYVILVAKRVMQEIGYDVFRNISVYEATIPPTNKISTPIDYVEYIRLSVISEDGTLIPLRRDKDLITSYNFVYDEEGYILVDEDGYYLKSEGTRKTYDAEMSKYKFSKCSTPGYYKYDTQRREFILYGIDSAFSRVVIEYVADSVMSEKDVTKLGIHRFLQQSVEDGIYYKCIEGDRNTPQSEVMRARHEFYNSKRLARMRFMKPDEFKQSIGKI